MTKPSKKLKDKLKGRKPYVKRARGQIETAVFCPLSGNQIKGLIVLDDLQEKQRIGNTLVIRERVAVSQLDNYTEITIEMDDGSAHVSAICKSVAAGLTLAQLTELYEADMAQVLHDEEAGRGEVLWEFWENRKPVRVADQEN